METTDLFGVIVINKQLLKLNYSDLEYDANKISQVHVLCMSWGLSHRKKYANEVNRRLHLPVASFAYNKSGNIRQCG